MSQVRDGSEELLTVFSIRCTAAQSLLAGFNVIQPKPGSWPVWRINRLIQIMDYKAQGMTNIEVAEKLTISRNTVSRELNSDHAVDIGKRMLNRVSGLMWSLADRQLKQIETGGLSPTGQVIYRQRLMSMLAGMLPRRVEQKIEAEITGEVKMIDVTEEDFLAVAYPVLKELLRREAQGADAAQPEENLEEPVG